MTCSAIRRVQVLAATVVTKTERRYYLLSLSAVREAGRKAGRQRCQIRNLCVCLSWTCQHIFIGVENVFC